MFVPVVDQNNRPLMPTTPSRAKRWIKSGKATPFFKKGVFCVRLNQEPSNRNTQPIAVGIEERRKREGFTVKSKMHTYLNIQTHAVDWVKDHVEVRRNMRRARRFRNTPCRQNRKNRLVNKQKLPPSTKARWQWKLRICKWLALIFPVSTFVVEDIKAKTWKNGRKWNLIFSPLEDFLMSSIEKIVEQCLQDGYLTPAMEAEVGRICDNASELSIEEYMALDKLMGALLTGEVEAVPRKEFINVMEELVLTEAIARIAEIEATSETSLEVGDVAAYALNRLPPLYATTEEGASYQRKRAHSELQQLIAQQIDEAISRYLDRPNFFPERQAINKNTGNDILQQVSTLLQACAPNFEQK